MKLPTTLVACVLTLFCLEQAHGRIGETEKQITTRYGTPLKQLAPLGSRDKCSIFVFNGFKITVTFLDGTSQDEEFIRIPDAPLSDTEITTLLSANAPAPSWTLSSNTSSAVKEWCAQGEKYEILATYCRTRSGYNLQIGTVDFIRYVSDQMVQKEKSRLEGF